MTFFFLLKFIVVLFFHVKNFQVDMDTEDGDSAHALPGLDERNEITVLLSHDCSLDGMLSQSLVMQFGIFFSCLIICDFWTSPDLRIFMSSYCQWGILICMF